MTYAAPLRAITAAIKHAGRIEELAATGGFPNYDESLLTPVLEEAGKLCSDIIAPTNQIAHAAGAKLVGDDVLAAPGLKEAYAALCEGGWPGLAVPEKFGGQGLPRVLHMAVLEMVISSNMAFSLCPLLTAGAIEAIKAHGNDMLQQRFLPKLVSGEWSCAMALTEPQAGSDVGALKTKAVPNGDGTYAITGQKIYITWGDHDMTENMGHLVLARLPDAPAGPKGISLFFATKFHVDENDNRGERNTFKCIGLEDKMGIHASPTCVIEYDNATGYLIGEPHAGLACMFTMMNDARQTVGLQGVGCSEIALQTARAYAADRSQFGQTIATMPDVQRMIARMAAYTQASRGICYATGAAADMAHYATDEATRHAAKAREDLLTPIAKAWSTDRGCDAASLGVQVHGGMGYMAETLASQIHQDVRITPIYEGTNGIQAIDLMGRKLQRDQGAAMASLIAEIRQTAERASATGKAPFDQLGLRLSDGADTLASATQWMLDAQTSNQPRAPCWRDCLSQAGRRRDWRGHAHADRPGRTGQRQ